MQPLLGVREDERYDTQSTRIETEEEVRFEAGVGAGGAFGNMVEQERSEGMERTVWEFREEGVESESPAAPSQAAQPVQPVQSRRERAIAPTVDEKISRPSKTVYKFVNTSNI